MQKNRIVSLLLVLLGAFDAGAQQPDEAPPPLLDIQEAPSFPGGDAELLKFLNTNIKYPQAARDSNIEGAVVLGFAVEKDGSISNMSIVKDIGGGCGQEAVRVATLMPRWIPGEANGKPVKVLINLPVRFKLEGDEPAPPPPPVEPRPDSVPEKTYEMFDIQRTPAFPGGEAALLNYLGTHIQYPEEARKKGIQGSVALTFVVEKDGSLSEVRILKNIGGGCGEEAARVVAAMPRWIPGEANGKPVRVRFTLPLRFRL